MIRKLRWKLSLMSSDTSTQTDNWVEFNPSKPLIPFYQSKEVLRELLIKLKRKLPSRSIQTSFTWWVMPTLLMRSAAKLCIWVWVNLTKICFFNEQRSFHVGNVAIEKRSNVKNIWFWMVSCFIHLNKHSVNLQRSSLTMMDVHLSLIVLNKSNNDTFKDLLYLVECLDVILLKRNLKIHFSSLLGY